MATIAEQLRALADQLDQGGGGEAKQKLLQHQDNPRASMNLTEDGEYFTEPFWMEGYVGALPGVRLKDWINEQFMATVQSGGRPQHIRVLVSNMGQLHVSPADIGWMDSSWFDPDNYPDDTACIEAWVKAGCPTVGPRGKFGHLGRYMKSSDGHSVLG